MEVAGLKYLNWGKQIGEQVLLVPNTALLAVKMEGTTIPA